MPNARGRPPAYKARVQLKLPYTLLAQLKERYPEMLKPDGNFRYGVLSEFVERTLWKEIRK